MPRIEAIIFDIDGTLLDTSEFIYQAYEYVISNHGLPARNRKDIASQIGKKIEECYAFLAPGGDYVKMIADHNNFQAANVALVKAYEHVNEVLDELHKDDKKIALWTGRRHHVIDSLEYAGLTAGIFDCIVDASMTEKGKPHPEGIHNVLGKLGVSSNAVVMVGDAGLDIEAGRLAKTRANIGITHGFGTREELKSAGADYIVDTIDKIPEVLRKIEENGS